MKPFELDAVWTNLISVVIDLAVDHDIQFPNNDFSVKANDPRIQFLSDVLFQLNQKAGR